MSLYVVDVKPLSVFRDKVRSYTLFGAFCWAYRLLYGKDQLESFLEEFSYKPMFLFSSFFPKQGNVYYFPKPILLSERRENSQLDYKKLKRTKYIPQDILLEVLEGRIKTESQLYQTMKTPNDIRMFEPELIPHAQIDRITGSVEPAGEFYYEEVVIPMESFFLIKMYQPDFLPKIKAVLSLVEDLGIGGNRNSGLGKVSLSEPRKYEILEDYVDKKGERFITLSPVIPEKESYKFRESYYDYFVFRGCVDNDYDYKGMDIWKEKVLYLSEGSVLKVNSKKDFYGQLLTVKNKVYQYGFAFPLYIKE